MDLFQGSEGSIEYTQQSSVLRTGEGRGIRGKPLGPLTTPQHVPQEKTLHINTSLASP